MFSLCYHYPMADPNSTHTAPDRHGGVGRTNGAAELGTIVSVDAQRYSYTVRTMRGRALPGLPRKRSSPSDLTLLPVGVTVIVRFDLGTPYIDGVLDIPADNPTDAGIPTTGVGNASTSDFLASSQTGNYRANNEPSDMIPGDYLIGNASGARVGVLEGGVAMLMGSGLAAVRAHLLKDLVEIISRNYRHISDMGEFKIENKDGRVNMSFRGASDQASESGADEQNWTIRLDLGSVGDMFNFELTTPEGQTLFRMHVDSDGRCTIFGLDGVVLQSGARHGEASVNEQGGNAENIVRGDRTDTVDGAFTTNVGSDAAATVSGNCTTSCGGDHTTATVRDYGVSAGRDVSVTAAKAMTTNVLDGDSKTVVGQTTKPNGRYSVETLRGRILLKSLQGGNIEFETQTGTITNTSRKFVAKTNGSDSVILGGDALVAHITRFEQFETLVRAFMSAHDTHTHTVSGATSSPPVVGMTATIGRLIAACKSLRVGVGG